MRLLVFPFVTILAAAGVGGSGARPIAVRAADQTPSVTIETAHGAPRELKTKATLEQLLATYDLKKYTFTRRVVIEVGAMNHAMPVLTLNVRFAASPDDLLSSYIHEQLHWFTQGGQLPRQRAAVAELRQLYPRVPVGLPEGAENVFSTYDHLVVCYLEMIADREVIGLDRAAAVIQRKDHYTWIYATVVRDEKKIAAVVDRNLLRVQ